MVAKTTHGLSREKTGKRRHTKLYMLWSNIRYRCNNPKSKDYHKYGGRGITVCDEWNRSYQAFYLWAMENGYCDGLQIDRIDNEKGYSPDNCRFVTPKVNSNNRRNSKLIDFHGRKMTRLELAEITGIPWQSLYRYNDDEVIPYIEKRLANANKK